MLTAIRATYEDGHITLREKPPVDERTDVIIIFPEKPPQPDRKPRKAGSLAGRGSLPADFNEADNKPNRQGGSMAGEVWMADDFNAPLDDLKDYM